MSRNTYNAIRIVVIIITAGLISWSVNSGNAWIPILVIIAALLILFILRRRVKEVVVDERVYSIAEKASYLALRIFGIAAAAGVAILIALGQKTPELEIVGLTLTLSVCGLVLVYCIANLYYNRKHSGQK